MCDDRPWKLIAPWWRWPKLGEPGRDVRASQPVIQKYDSSDPVTPFTKDPQTSLAYGPDDIVQSVRTLSPIPMAGGKRTRFSDYYLEPTGTRKIFLPNHKRFYLVVCELHCDLPGLPSVNRDKVCEMGLVVRRETLRYRPEHAARAAELVERAGVLTAQIARIDRNGSKQLLKKRHKQTAGGVFGGGAGGTAVQLRSRVEVALDASHQAKRAELETELAQLRAELVQWKAASGATTVSEGWVPSRFENVGAWQVVGEEPGEVTETVYPLYPLIPDPREERHDAVGKTIYFGLLPTGSREVEVDGRARFDDSTRYVVRCFVRRHRCDCPKTGERNDCGGELVWSEPTEAFQLAPHFDPVGTANHPINIQLPDIPALAATPARLPVQMTAPAGSALNFRTDSEGKPGDPSIPGFPQICFFSIPLITIIATFVLNLFLPIVVFLFQLWFLLGLKFCIPPSLSFSAGASAQLDAKLDLKLQAELDLAVDINASAAVGAALAADLNLSLTGAAGATINTNASGDITSITGLDPLSPGARMQAGYANEAMLSLNESITADRSAEVASGSVTAGLTFEARVERAEVAA